MASFVIGLRLAKELGHRRLVSRQRRRRTIAEPAAGPDAHRAARHARSKQRIVARWRSSAQPRLRSRSVSASDPVEGDRNDGARDRVPGQRAAAVPLDDRVRHPEDEPRGRARVDVARTSPVALRLRDDLGDGRSNARRRRRASRSLFDAPCTRNSTVSSGSRCSVVSATRSTMCRSRSAARPSRAAGSSRIANERVERAAEPALEQRFLAADVMVDRRLGDPGRARDVVHRRAVVAALGEDAQRDVGQRVDVVRLARFAAHGAGHGAGASRRSARARRGCARKAAATSGTQRVERGLVLLERRLQRRRRFGTPARRRARECDRAGAIAVLVVQRVRRRARRAARASAARAPAGGRCFMPRVDLVERPVDAVDTSRSRSRGTRAARRAARRVHGLSGSSPSGTAARTSSPSTCSRAV